MTESTPTTVPGHAALRAQAAELRLPDLLAHWDELMGQPESEQRVRQWLGWESAARAERSRQLHQTEPRTSLDDGSGRGIPCLCPSACQT